MADIKKLVELFQQQQEESRKQQEESRKQLEIQQEESRKQIEIQQEESRKQQEESRKQLEIQQEENRKQLEIQQEESRKQQEESRRQWESQQEENRRLIDLLVKKSEVPAATVSIPTFPAFDPTSELWTDYYARFHTFIGAHSIPADKVAKVFLTTQSSITYKLLSNLSSQLETPTDINELTMDNIKEFMQEQYDAKRFVVRERYKFWSDMQRKPGETVQELATRIRHQAATCNFPEITDPLDEAMRTKFMCSVSNEGVLKSLFKVKGNDLTFAKAVETALEIEDAAKVAKETVYGAISKEVRKVNYGKGEERKGEKKSQQNSPASQQSTQGSCYRCDRTGHQANSCRFINATCNYCKKVGHIEAACRQKKKMNPNSSRTRPVKTISTDQLRTVRRIESLPQLLYTVQLEDKIFSLELDTGAADNFITKRLWMELGEPQLQPSDTKYESASKHQIKVLGHCTLQTQISEGEEDRKSKLMSFAVTEIPNLNLLGRDAIKQLDISLDNIIGVPSSTRSSQAREATKSQEESEKKDDEGEEEEEIDKRVAVSKTTRTYSAGDSCYALYCGPRRDQQPRWVPAVITKLFGSRSVNVRVHPKGPVWRRHVEQLLPRYSSQEDDEPGEEHGSHPVNTRETSIIPAPNRPPNRSRLNPRLPTGGEYGPHNPRRSRRHKH